MYYNRYSKFIGNGKIEFIPHIIIPNKSTDKSKIWKVNIDKLDILSNEYYGHPYGGWLIMLANRQFGSDELSIPDNALIKIPYPYQASIQQYNDQVELYKKKYG